MQKIKSKVKKHLTLQKISILILFIIVVFLLLFFFKDILIPFVKYQAKGNSEAATKLLADKGMIGYACVTLIEALQMVIVFIPAEFIQLSSGMAYPWYLAIILLDFGVILGASMIWMLVHIFRFDNLSQKANVTIGKYAKKARNTQILMYFLFFMPIIPFGAICYFASNSKIKYPRYIFTCATGVIPSIVTSILMGTAINEFIKNTIPLYLLIIIIVSCALLLFIAIFLLINKFILKQDKNTPDYFMYSFMNKLLSMITKKGKHYRFFNQELIDKLDNEYIIACNHPGYYDFYRIHLLFNRNLSNVANRHLVSAKMIGKLARRSGFIPKKLFDADLETAVKTKRMLKAGYPVVIFPEGRLSIDGTCNPIVENFAGFVKALKCDLVTVRIEGAYLAENKWHKKKYRTKINVSIVNVYKKDDIKEMDTLTLSNAVKQDLTFNDFTYSKDLHIYKDKNKARNLEHILYMCPKCKKLYSMHSIDNTLYCDNCGKSFNILDNYHFDDPTISTIHDYYEFIKNEEYQYIQNLNSDFIIECDVDVKIYRKNSHKYDLDEGFCYLTKDSIVYKSHIRDYEIRKDLKTLQVLPFGCNDEFEFYHEDRLHYFYPKDNRLQCARWGLLVDLLYQDILKSNEENKGMNNNGK